MRTVVLLDAPSNLGLRPPSPGTVPGCYKLAGALRDQRLLDRLGAVDGGVVVPPRYDREGWQPGDGVFNAAAIAGYSRRLGDRLDKHLSAGEFPVVLGGDCSIVLAAGLALRRRGRYGLAFVDGHSDFRHPGNSTGVGAAAGEDLALSTGRGQSDLTDIDGLGPYFRDDDVHVLGIRDADTARDELAGLGIRHAAVSDIRSAGAGDVARAARRHLESAGADGFWVHLDADVLDPSIMPAVDSPDPDGLTIDEVRALLTVLLASPGCVGFQLAVYDPDLDPAGTGAALLADLVEAVIAFTPSAAGDPGRRGPRNLG
ncbi:arginase family protein [Actinoplanes sp. CA-142083]|uniref:arginase family protein n=1 Tax=Actinoplanes sp. CA-142083 TaxID=3239903 RepID=UPI003D8AD12C